jgi:soluble lytic murein transglycosylase
MKQTLKNLSLAMLATALAYPIVSAANTTSVATSDTALIVQAKAAFEKGRAAELDRIAVKTKGHLLAAWPEYWSLRLRITSPQADAKNLRLQVLQFAKRHAAHPLAERAHIDLIDALVKRELWEDAFIALQTLPGTSSSAQIDCTRAKSTLLQSGQTADAAAQRAVGQESAQACLALVNHLANEGLVDAVYLKERLRWAAQTASGPARNRMLEIVQAHAKTHDSEVRGPNPVTSERYLAETLQQTRSNSLQAYETLSRHRKSLNHEQIHYAAFAVGAALWQRSHPNAWPLILEGWPSLSQQPGQVLQMAAREAIRRHEWERLAELINAMSANLQQDPTWVYWKAVSIAETQGAEHAEVLFKSLRHDYGFYGVLARERLKEPLRIPQTRQAWPTDKDLRTLDSHLGMQRSYALLRAGLRAEAVQEWTAAMRGKTDQELLLAARHAQAQGLTDRMIAAADRTREQHDFELRYPAAFKDNVLPAARAQSLDPWWVLGLIRQESRFIPDIRSSVGATGLMQIMPATGKMLAKEAGIKNTQRLALSDVNLNIQLGTKYLRQLHDKFDGSAVLASAAYNAGPSRAARWRSALPKPIDGAAFAESIPFSETRDYVKRVLTNAVLYHAVHNGGEAPSLKTLLGEIIPGQTS